MATWAAAISGGLSSPGSHLFALALGSDVSPLVSLALASPRTRGPRTWTDDPQDIKVVAIPSLAGYRAFSASAPAATAAAPSCGDAALTAAAVTTAAADACFALLAGPGSQLRQSAWPASCCVVQVGRGAILSRPNATEPLTHVSALAAAIDVAVLAGLPWLAPATRGLAGTAGSCVHSSLSLHHSSADTVDIATKLAKDEGAKFSCADSWIYPLPLSAWTQSDDFCLRCPMRER